MKHAVPVIDSQDWTAQTQYEATGDRPCSILSSKPAPINEEHMQARY
jgi:hypothetical protein